MKSQSFAAVVWSLAIAGCGANPGDTDSAGDDRATRDCSQETRADTYAVGLSKAGERLQVRFVDAVPAPPDRGNNRWTLAIEDLQGDPVEDMTVEVDPFMPDHMHGTSIRAHVTPGEAPGQYVVEPVNLFMPGLWEVTLDLTTAGDETDAVVFRFCVDP